MMENVARNSAQVALGSTAAGDIYIPDQLRTGDLPRPDRNPSSESPPLRLAASQESSIIAPLPCRTDYWTYWFTFAMIGSRQLDRKTAERETGTPG
jgi:hypothetical protein